MFSDFNSKKYDLKKNNSNDIRSYVIASTPRSGSTLLGKLLANTNLAGVPHEYLHDKHSKDYLSRWNIEKNIEHYIKELYKFRTSENNIFGIKIHYHQLKNFNLVDTDLLSILHSPKFIFIKRKNKIEQAISFAKALQTKQWAIENNEKSKEAIYIYKEIELALSQLHKEEKQWEDFFKDNNIEYFTLFYEDFTSDLNAWIRKILNYLEIDHTKLTKIQKSSLQKMANKSSKEWYERFIKEKNE